MSQQCLVCNQPAKTCEYHRDGVCQLLDAETQAHVDALVNFRRESKVNAQVIEDYNALPQALCVTHFEWRIRCADVDIVRGFLKNRSNQTILEIGAWNGWLSHHLVREGHRVTSIAFSADPKMGIGTIRHYNVDWHAIQTRMTDLSQFQTSVDVVVINHGLHLFPDPVTYVKQAEELLVSGGLLIVLCMIFHRNPKQRIQAIQAADTACKEAVGVSYFLNPTRGYMTHEDKQQFAKSGLTLHPYRQMWRANLKAQFVRTAPTYVYGVKTKQAGT